MQGTRPFDETKLPKAEEAARLWEVFKPASAGGVGQMPAETFKTLVFILNCCKCCFGGGEETGGPVYKDAH